MRRLPGKPLDAGAGFGDRAAVEVVVAQHVVDRPAQHLGHVQQALIDRAAFRDVAADQHRIGVVRGQGVEELQSPLDGNEIQVDISGPRKTHTGMSGIWYWISDLRFWI